MIIDAHTHLGSNSNLNATVDQLLKSMDAAGIDKALVLAGSINGCPNEDMLRQIAPHQDRLYGVAAVELGQMAADTSDFREEFRRNILRPLMENPNIVAAKFYLGYEHYMPGSCRVYDAMREVQRAEKAAIFHTGDCYRGIRNAKLKYAHPLGIDDVATDFPDVPIVMAHMGWPWILDAAEVCHKNPNVYADVSGFVYGKFSPLDKDRFTEALHEFMEIAPPGRLIFGSDWPISDQTSYVEAVYSDWGSFFSNSITEKVFSLKR